MIPYSQWCHPGPGRRGGLSDETPPPSARALVDCWDPHWSQRYSESVWRGLRTCGCQGEITEHVTQQVSRGETKRHIHNPPWHHTSSGFCSPAPKLWLMKGVWSVKLMQATEENMCYATLGSHWHQYPSKPHSAAVWEEEEAAENVLAVPYLSVLRVSS